MNRLQRANERERGGPHAPPRAWTAAHNLPVSGKAKALHQHAIFDRPVALIFDGLCHLLAMVLGSARPAERGIFRTGEAAMAKVLNEILLCSSRGSCSQPQGCSSNRATNKRRKSPAVPAAGLFAWRVACEVRSAATSARAQSSWRRR